VVGRFRFARASSPAALFIFLGCPRRRREWVRDVAASTSAQSLLHAPNGGGLGSAPGRQQGRRTHVDPGRRVMRRRRALPDAAGGSTRPCVVLQASGPSASRGNPMTAERNWRTCFPAASRRDPVYGPDVAIHRAGFRHAWLALLDRTSQKPACPRTMPHGRPSESAARPWPGAWKSIFKSRSPSSRLPSATVKRPCEGLVGERGRSRLHARSARRGRKAVRLGRQVPSSTSLP